MNKQNPKTKKIISVYLTVATLDRLKAYCTNNVGNLSWLIEKLIVEYLDKAGEGEK